MISGQLRTFAQCWPTQRWHVLRHFTDPEFFICVQYQQDAPDILRPLYEEFGEARVHLTMREDPDLSADLTPELSRAYNLAPYTNAAPALQLLLQHWGNREVWRHFKATQQKEFSTVIRLRPDMLFHSFRAPVLSGFFFNEVHVPRWGGFAGYNDRFAVMGEEAAGAYFSVYDHIPELIRRGCPFHPETLLAATLDAENVKVHKLPWGACEFSTLRMDGKVRHWTSEILPSELAA